MEIDDSDAENIVVQKDGDSGGNTGVQSARSGDNVPQARFPGARFDNLLSLDTNTSKGSTPCFPASANHSHKSKRQNPLDLSRPARRSSCLTRAAFS